MTLAPGQQLYEYRIGRALGQGGFGTVYLAHDTLLDRPVAIKELTVTRQTDEQAFKRFMQEARTAGGLNHPNIVTVYALKMDGSNVYLVMEYVSGGSLRTLMEKPDSDVFCGFSTGVRKSARFGLFPAYGYPQKRHISPPSGAYWIPTTESIRTSKSPL
jgi:serine/threonine protein kinase